jgi:hypothetical protein
MAKKKKKKKKQQELGTLHRPWESAHFLCYGSMDRESVKLQSSTSITAIRLQHGLLTVKVPRLYTNTRTTGRPTSI